jgi:hypothetical protein
VAAADGGAPPGNNGTIKIDEFVMDGGLGNDPHVACGFSVSFFGYDTGAQDATILISPWEPTRGGKPFTTPTSWVTAMRSGGNQFDANVQIRAEQLAAAFAGIAPAAQGLHVRVEVHVTGSQGADTKFKMLWVEPCEVASPVVAHDTTTTTVVTAAPGASHNNALPENGTVVPGSSPGVAAAGTAVPPGNVAPGTVAFGTVAPGTVAPPSGSEVQKANVLAATAVNSQVIPVAAPATALALAATATG